MIFYNVFIPLTNEERTRADALKLILDYHAESHYGFNDLSLGNLSAVGDHIVQKPEGVFTAIPMAVYTGMTRGAIGESHIRIHLNGLLSILQKNGFSNASFECYTLSDANRRTFP